jgi:NAD(P)H-binding
MNVLVVGATGSIGQLVVDEAIRQGHTVRALARDPRKARQLPKEAAVIVGDLTRPETLAPAVDEVDAIVFTHGSDGGGKAGSERVDYGGVRNVLAALQGRSVRIALMTAIGVTNREGDYNRQTEAADWKRRGERLALRQPLPGAGRTSDIHAGSADTCCRRRRTIAGHREPPALVLLQLDSIYQYEHTHVNTKGKAVRRSPGAARSCEIAWRQTNNDASSCHAPKRPST